MLRHTAAARSSAEQANDCRARARRARVGPVRILASRAAVHALVGYGTIGKGQDIQRWRCQVCQMTYSCRRGTPLYYLKSAPAQVDRGLWFLAEGVDVSVMVRYTGRSEAPVTRWLERSGQQSARWHRVLFQGLSVA